MKKFTFLLLTLLTCLGIFAGCTDNRVPQPDEGDSSFVSLEGREYNNEVGIEYSDIEQIIKSSLRTAGISEDFQLEGISSFAISNTVVVSVTGTVRGKPILLTMSKISDEDFFTVSSISKPTDADNYIYWVISGSMEGALEDYLNNCFYDFYSGKKLSWEEYQKAHP